MSLFWRLWWRSVSVKRPQALLAVGALLVGAAVTAALLNLYGDVRRKMTQEIRAYGANVIVSSASASELMDESALARIQALARRRPGLAAAPVVYAVVRVRRMVPDARLPDFENVVAVGTDFAALRALHAGWHVQGGLASLQPGTCAVGAHLAARLHVAAGDSLKLEALDSSRGAASLETLRIASLVTTGGSEDDQVFVPLSGLQHLASLAGKLSLVEISAPGETRDVEGVVRELAGDLPGLDVRPVRQIVGSEGRVLATVRWLLLSLTALILIITALCVMATMITIVLERRKDIGVMKALGASDTLVMRLFLAEGAGMGLVGGLGGFLLGSLVAGALAKRLFAVSLSLTWWTFPLVCLLTLLLAVVATFYPVRMIRGIRPAVVLKGE